MPGLNEGSTANYHKIANETAPFRLPMLDEISSESGIALEIGCGSGMDTVELARRNRYAIGLDLQLDNVRRALEYNRECKLDSDFVCANAEMLPFKDGVLDTVYSYGVLHHTEGTQQAIDEIHRVLKKGGRVCVMLYHQGLPYYLIVVVRGILQGNLLRMNMERLFSRFYDNTPLSKAYSRHDVKHLFRKFKIRTQVNAFRAVRRNEKLRWVWYIYGNKFLERLTGSYIHAIGEKP